MIEGPGGREEIPVVRESGMLRLTLLGKNEHARAFQRWVLREVLPSALHDESQYGEEKLRAQKDRASRRSPHHVPRTTLRRGG
ncbi:hypothetical protein [Alicyclobacillus acidocaldarius]|uniref:hypothetical protein n=1 Tax=Alicyclobacillus acidocaldarius TaxID=405212 RepID=UPI001ED94502|nr:hypothetical protein [Alicyclobacillus acidocaldarius]